jgi:hypothetical protein
MEAGRRWIAMSDLQTVIEATDALSPQELEMLYQHIAERRKQQHWYISGDTLNKMYDLMRPVHEASAHMSEEEINAAIDDALNEVRREQANRRD